MIRALPEPAGVPILPVLLRRAARGARRGRCSRPGEVDGIAASRRRPRSTLRTLVHFRGHAAPAGS